jgi:LacI family transcriptional regulator
VDSDLTLRGCLGVSDTAEAVTRLLKSDDPPTAIFAANNRAAIGALVAMARSPRKAEIVAFDDFELAELLQPPITVVGYDTAELGRLAADLLFKRIDGDDGPPRRITVPVRLNVRTPHGY